MVYRSVIKAGNSLAVTLPAEALERFGLQQGARVRVEVDEERGGILITPEARDTGIDADFDARVRGFIERYRPALEKLAER